MTDEDRRDAIEDIENILILHGIMPGNEDFDDWTDEELENFDIESYLAHR